MTAMILPGIWVSFAYFSTGFFFFFTLSKSLAVLTSSIRFSLKIFIYFGRGSRRKSENQWAKLAMVTLAAGVLTLGSVHDASAAKSGGRVGGQAFRSSGPKSSPRVNQNSR